MMAAMEVETMEAVEMMEVVETRVGIPIESA